MTFITGDNKIVNIGLVKSITSNALEVILRESGRFVMRYGESFVALSEKKTRTITIAGSIGAGSQAEHFHEYDQNPENVQFESGDIFPQDMLIEYPCKEVEIYGVQTLITMSLSSEPADAVARLKGGHLKYWISRKPITSWNNEDCIGFPYSAYQTTPENGLVSNAEGVIATTTKKNSIPIFTPIKSSFSVEKLKDILYLYIGSHGLGYCAASTNGGSISGSIAIDTRLVIGKGFLPEEVEELLSPSQ
ncbi:MAG: hypothetical protein EU529_05890 [Promethearchaeota archaeon]|nr:MAG: hypothetical protein EU529_05890 [Candidatus Lokiarchaeota archaeon]